MRYSLDLHIAATVDIAVAVVIFAYSLVIVLSA